MNTGEYYNAQEEDSERIAKRKRRRQIDLSLNWLFFALLSFNAFWILLEDINTYQSEKIYLRLLNDGVSMEELRVSDPYLTRGMERNLPYKGLTPTAFFFAKWKWRIPVYLGFLLLPITVAGIRAWRYDRLRLNWAYFPLVVLGFAYAVYFWGRLRGMW